MLCIIIFLIHIFYLFTTRKNYNNVHYKCMSRKKEEQAKYRITTKADMEIKGVDKRSLSRKVVIYLS